MVADSQSSRTDRDRRLFLGTVAVRSGTSIPTNPVAVPIPEEISAVRRLSRSHRNLGLTTRLAPILLRSTYSPQLHLEAGGAIIAERR